MNYTGIVPEYYYGIHKASNPLQELNSLAIDTTNQLLFGKIYKRTEKMDFPSNYVHFLPIIMKKTLLMFEIITS